MPKQEYAAELKEQSVKRAQEAGVAAAARELSLLEQTLRNWFKAGAARKLNVAVGAKLPGCEQAVQSKSIRFNSQPATSVAT